MVHSTPPVQHTNSVLIEEIRKIIWSEWNDANVNAIKWDIPFKARKEDGPFDPHPVFLPASLHPMIYQWKSFHELFQEPLSIFVETNDIPKFVDENRHLFHSEFMRNFFSSICLLQYISTKDIFLIERETTVFSCGTSGQPWRPWHHIYSGNKAGKGQGAKPVFNNAGTYVIRLFYLGFWREIIVDDQVPVDINDIPLLPFLTVNGTLVVWPILLSKALLKIAQLSWTVNCELVDFDIITCLTGWIAQNVELKNLSNEDIWKICRAYSNHYVWPATNVEVLQTKAGKGKEPPKEIPKAPPYYVTGNIKDLRHLEKEEIPDITPCWSHSFLIEQSRDIPLTKPEPRKDIVDFVKPTSVKPRLPEKIPDKLGFIESIKAKINYRVNPINYNPIMMNFIKSD